MSEEKLFSPVGADVSDDIQQLGMLSVYKPDTKAPIGNAKEVKSDNAKNMGKLCSCCIARMSMQRPLMCK
ncbi:MAG: hypothetical protein Q4D07_00005, partial [Selenomonadaceae bacterium]|nr:hypothetical protein [Selenomonadaceae bacterium]